jgi:hypothetical protein
MMAEVPKEKRKLKRFRRHDLNTNLLQVCAGSLWVEQGCTAFCSVISMALAMLAWPVLY